MQTRQIEIWSPKFGGSKASWDWICNASNGRVTVPNFYLNATQMQDAVSSGYLTEAFLKQGLVEQLGGIVNSRLLNKTGWW